MSDTNNTTNVPAPKIEETNWTKKGNKIVYGNICDLKPDPILNIRFRGGSEVLGITVTQDTLDIGGMKQQLVDGNGVREPIWVSVRANGDKVPLRGNRRTFAGQELAADPTISPELKKALTEGTPMILLFGLTPGQEQEHVEDQTQKPFLRCEVVRHIFALRKQSWTYERIAMLLWETLGRFSGQAKKVAEVRDIQDPTTKREKIKTWLRGTLDNYLIWGCDLGQWMQKQILLSEMKVDGVLGETNERPYFDTTKNAQKRVAALRKAKDADGAKYSPLMLMEGTEFKKVADSFHVEDYGLKPVVAKAEVKKLMDRKTIEGLRDTYQSSAVRNAFSLVLGEPVPTMQSVDDRTIIFETKLMLVEQFLPRLRPEVAAIVRACLVNADPTDFQTLLETMCVPEEQEDKGVTEFSLTEGEVAEVPPDA